MSFEEDPEVVADLRLRAATEYDRSRSRGAGVYDWKAPPLVGAWRCRVKACKAVIPVTAEAMEYLAQCNAWLRARDEQPIGIDEVAYCDRCKSEFKRTAPDRRRGQVDRLGVKIRELKESRDPAGERDVIMQLREWGHPDVDGLVQALQERNRTATGKPRRSL